MILIWTAAGLDKQQFSAEIWLRWQVIDENWYWLQRSSCGKCRSRMIQVKNPFFEVGFGLNWSTFLLGPVLVCSSLLSFLLLIIWTKKVWRWLQQDIHLIQLRWCIWFFLIFDDIFGWSKRRWDCKQKEEQESLQGQLIVYSKLSDMKDFWGFIRVHYFQWSLMDL